MSFAAFLSWSSSNFLFWSNYKPLIFICIFLMFNFALIIEHVFCFSLYDYPILSVHFLCLKYSNMIIPFLHDWLYSIIKWSALQFMNIIMSWDCRIALAISLLFSSSFGSLIIYQPDWFTAKSLSNINQQSSL